MLVRDVLQLEHRARRKRLWGNPVPEIPKIDPDPIPHWPPPPVPRMDWSKWIGIVAEAYGRDEFIPQPIRSEHIIDAVCNHFNVEKKDLCGRRRGNDIIPSRFACVFLIRWLTDLSFPQIGRVLGKRDHSTVLNAFEKVCKRTIQDQEYAQELAGIEWNVREHVSRLPKVRTIALTRKGSSLKFKKTTTYFYITDEEAHQAYAMHHTDRMSFGQIGKALNRHPSAIGRVIRRIERGTWKAMKPRT